MLFEDEDLSTESLYQKYMAFNKIMLEDHQPIEIASIMLIQGLTFFKTIMDDEDYQKIVQLMYDKRNEVKTL